MPIHRAPSKAISTVEYGSVWPPHALNVANAELAFQFGGSLNHKNGSSIPPVHVRRITARVKALGCVSVQVTSSGPSVPCVGNGGTTHITASAMWTFASWSGPTIVAARVCPSVPSSMVRLKHPLADANSATHANRIIVLLRSEVLQTRYRSTRDKPQACRRSRKATQRRRIAHRVNCIRRRHTRYITR